MTALEYAQAEAARLAKERTQKNQEEMEAWERDATKRRKLQYVVDMAYAQFSTLGFKPEGHALHKDRALVAFVEVVQAEQGARIKWFVEGSDNHFSELEEEFNRDFGRAMGRFL